jgi:hypothetical protein
MKTGQRGVVRYLALSDYKKPVPRPHATHTARTFQRVHMHTTGHRGFSESHHRYHYTHAHYTI